MRKQAESVKKNTVSAVLLTKFSFNMPFYVQLNVIIYLHVVLVISFSPLFCIIQNKIVTANKIERPMDKATLSEKKLEFIQKIISETSLDTLCSWFDMYEEAKYVASLYSDEPELKVFNAQYNESLRQGWTRRDNLT